MVSTVLVLVLRHFRIIHIHQISDSYADEPQQMLCFNVFIYSVQATSAAVLGLLNFQSGLLEFFEHATLIDASDGFYTPPFLHVSVRADFYAALYFLRSCSK